MNQVEKGKRGEEKAVVFLEKNGVRILFQNYRCRQGEVDIIGLHENCLVFIEVKYRKDKRQGMPEEAVGVKKQIKICRTSDYFRMSHRAYAEMQVRYDVIAMINEEIKWYQNAFEYQNRNERLYW